ncbi:MAG: ribonuclease H-like domain-containing protein [Bacillota bacterium]
MNLRDKLKNMPGRSREKSGKQPGADKGSSLPGERGQHYLRVERISLQHEHGGYRPDQLSQQVFTEAGSLYKFPPGIEREKLLFLDTETTGLAGGAGTFAFLVGLAYFSGSDLVLEQHMMRDYDEELELLLQVGEKLKDHPYPVTFNGKSYDLPLLKTRFILNRLEFPDVSGHYDLLHPCRSVWKHLPSCSLTALENDLLDFHRQDDIDGSQVPEIYFNYLQNKDMNLLEPVLSHNRLDIISLVSLSCHLEDIVKAEPKNITPSEAYNLGRLHEKRGSREESIAYLEQARTQVDSRALLTRIDKKLSWQYKRCDQYEAAVAIWNEMVSEQRGALFPWVELAKYYEHQVKDYEKAAELVESAQDYLIQKRYYISGWKKTAQELEHRLARLKKKRS